MPYTVEERTIRRERIAPHLSNGEKRIFYPGLEVEARPGIGNIAEPGLTPKMMLLVSFDGGYTYGPEVWMRAGELGDYLQRLTARQLGYGRDTVFRVVCSDPNVWDLVGAYLEPSPIVGRY